MNTLFIIYYIFSFCGSFLLSCINYSIHCKEGNEIICHQHWACGDWSILRLKSIIVGKSSPYSSLNHISVRILDIHYTDLVGHGPLQYNYKIYAERSCQTNLFLIDLCFWPKKKSEKIAVWFTQALFSISVYIMYQFDPKSSAILGCRSQKVMTCRAPSRFC